MKLRRGHRIKLIISLWLTVTHLCTHTHLYSKCSRTFIRVYYILFKWDPCDAKNDRIGHLLACSLFHSIKNSFKSVDFRKAASRRPRHVGAARVKCELLAAWLNRNYSDLPVAHSRLPFSTIIPIIDFAETFEASSPLWKTSIKVGQGRIFSLYPPITTPVDEAFWSAEPALNVSWSESRGNFVGGARWSMSFVIPLN